MPGPLEPESTNPLLIPWYRGLEDPEDAQVQTLIEQLKGYAETAYGRARFAHVLKHRFLFRRFLESNRQVSSVGQS